MHLPQDVSIADLLAPLADPNARAWGSEVEIERRRRIWVAAWAYAYEIDVANTDKHDDDRTPIASDADYDRECRRVRPEMETGNAVLDKFFREEFDPSTGLWVHKHPDKPGLERLAARLRKLSDGRVK